MKALFIFLLFVAATEAIGTKDDDDVTGSNQGNQQGGGGGISTPLTFKEFDPTSPNNQIFILLSQFARFCYNKRPQTLEWPQYAYFAVVAKSAEADKDKILRNFEPDIPGRCEAFYVQYGDNGYDHTELTSLQKMFAYRRDNNNNLEDKDVTFYLYTVNSPCAKDDWNSCQDHTMNAVIANEKNHASDSMVVGFRQWYQYETVTNPPVQGIQRSCVIAFRYWCSRLAERRSRDEFKALTAAKLKYVWYNQETCTAPNVVIVIPNTC